MNSDTVNAEYVQICRVCFEKCNKHGNILKDVCKMIEICTSVKMSNINIFPFWICSKCILTLKEFYKFKIRCALIEKYLNDYNFNKQDKQSFVTYIEKLKESVTNEVETQIFKEFADLSSFNKLDKKLETNRNVCDSLVTELNENIPPDIDENHDSPLCEENESNDKNTQLNKCGICGKVLARANSLYRHLQSHSDSREFLAKCTVCSKGFYERGNLNRHMLRHKGEKRFECTECSKQFYELNGLLRHSKQHKTLKPTLKCENCDDLFIFQIQLDAHMKSHAINKCKYCKKQFTHPYLVRRHETSHSVEQPFKCSVCEKTFKHATTLELHRKQHYGIVKKEICNVCGLGFRNIRMHMMTHTTERPHKCTQCGKGCRTTVHLREHMRKHTGERRIPQVLCIVCGKKLLDTAKLRIHMRSHTGERPYSCLICDRKFVSGSLLTVHMRSHTGDKPYVCDVCGKAFKESCTLKSHVRIHTGERPYICNVCNKGFTQSGSLKTHMKIHPAI